MVDVVKVTDKAGSASDLVIQLTGSQQPIVFAKDHQQSVQVGETGKCAPASPPPASPPATTGSGSGSSTTSPPATTVALAQTGGFDFRFPLIGLAILVAGAVLYFVSVSRGRSASQR